MSNTFDFDINFNLLANEVKNLNIENMITNASNRETNKTNTAAVDCNDNYFSYKPHIGIPAAGDVNVNLYPDSDSITDLLPHAQAEKMEFAQQVGTQEPGDVESELAVMAELVGYAKVVIPVTREIVVQPVAGSKMLDSGTPIFMEQHADGQGGYRHIGSIWDIFGTVNEPMYSVIMMKEVMISDSFIVGCKVFFMCGHPETRYLSIECDGDSYVIKHSQSL